MRGFRFKSGIAVLLALLLGVTAGCGGTAVEAPKSPTVLVASDGGDKIPSPELLATRAYQKRFYELPKGKDRVCAACADGEWLYFLCAEAENNSVTELWRMNTENGMLVKVYTFSEYWDEGSRLYHTQILRRPGGGVLVRETQEEDVYQIPEDVTGELDAETRMKYYDRTVTTESVLMFTDDGKIPQQIVLSEGAAASVVTDETAIFVADDQSVKTYNADGVLQAECAQSVSVFDLHSAGGSVYAVTGKSSGDGSDVRTVDPVTGGFSEPTEMPYEVLYNSCGSLDGGIVALESGDVFLFRPAENKTEKLVDWLDYGIRPMDISQCTVTEDGAIIAVVVPEAEAEAQRFAVLTPSETVVLPASTLTLGTAYQTDRVVDAVLAFNEAGKGRIRLVDYSEFDLFSGENGTARMTAEIKSDRCPDLLYSSDTAGAVDQIAAGHLRDLTPMLTANPLQQERMFTSVTELLQTDGKLYCLAPVFYLHTTIGRESVLGDEELTTEKLASLADTLPAGGTAFSFYYNRDTALTEHLQRSGKYLHTSGGYELRSQVFYDGLELAAMMPKDADWSKFEIDDFCGWSRIRDGKQLLINGVYGNFTAVTEDLNAVGEDGRLYGWPGTPGYHALEFPITIGITEACRDTESAWRFVQSLMTASAQEAQVRRYSDGFPTNVTAFSEMAAEAMNADDEQLTLEAGTKRVTVSRRPTEAQYQMISDAVLGSVARVCYNYDFTELVSQAASAYFDGTVEAPVLAEQLQTTLEARAIK